jgi:hypothetical protein
MTNPLSVDLMVEIIRLDQLISPVVDRCGR